MQTFPGIRSASRSAHQFPKPLPGCRDAGECLPSLRYLGERSLAYQLALGNVSEAEAIAATLRALTHSRTPRSHGAAA